MLKILLVCLAIFSSSLCSIISIKPRIQQPISKEIHEGIRKFSVNLNKVMLQHCEKQDNVVFSPLSIYISLALAHLGSNGDTQNELCDSMCLPKDPEWQSRIHEDLGQVLRQIRNNKNANVSVANGMFVQNNLQVKDEFVQQIQKHYENTLVSVDFNGNEATDTVNKWFASKTNGRITRLSDEDISRDTRLLLANAICFSGNWDKKFPKESTKQETFRSEDGSEQDVIMMHKTEDVLYYNDPSNQFEAVGIPYQQQEYIMYLILPNEKQNLRQVADGLGFEHIQRILDEGKTTTVDIKLPQMKLQSNDRIKNILGELGVNRLFESPDLSNMLSDSNIRVGQVSHSFAMDLDEKGTDVCAGTTQEYKPRAQPRTVNASKQFYVQRPYMFFIYHTVTKSIVFYGSINNAGGSQ